MCGRYYSLNLEQMSKLSKIHPSLKIDELHFGETYPSDLALVLTKEGYQLMKWGFKKWDNKGLIINARQETVLSKPMFSEDFRHHRAIILARGFFEWDQNKQKYYVQTNFEVMFMAGFYKVEGNDLRFVILTQEATPSFASIHHRLPVLLSKEQINDYLLSDDVSIYTQMFDPILYTKKVQSR